MCALLQVVAFVVAVAVRALPHALADEPIPLRDGVAAGPDLQGLPPDVVALLKETRETYGSDALLLQLQLLHEAIGAGSILTAGVRVRGVETYRTRRYLVFFVETGIVFNSRQTHRRERASRLWSEIVTPAIERLRTCDVPAEGIAVELLYSHRPYRDMAELENTAAEDPGRYQQMGVYLLRDDILAFLQKKIDRRKLFSRSEARIDRTSSAATREEERSRD
jgi:hypothetical protein